MSEFETVIVQFPSFKCTRNVPASSISSLHSNPLESVAITSAPIEPEMPLPHVTPEPFAGESLNQIVP